MEPRPIRMSDELWEAVGEDAKAHDRETAEHVRRILREYLSGETRSVMQAHPLPSLQDVTFFHERVADSETRLDTLVPEDSPLPRRLDDESAPSANASRESGPIAGERDFSVEDRPIAGERDPTIAGEGSRPPTVEGEERGDDDGSHPGDP